MYSPVALWPIALSGGNEVTTAGAEPLLRTFSVRDPYGYQLWFYQHVSDVAPPPGVTMV